MTDPVRYTIDGSVRRVGKGTVLVGGSPLKLFRLTAAGATLLDRIESARPFTLTPAVNALIDRLLDAGVLHPLVNERALGESAEIGTVTVVIPAYNTPHHELTRLVRQCLDGGGPTVASVVIVDDASIPPLGEVDGATLVRTDVNRGPGAARSIGLAATQTPFVAFVDTDIELSSQWLAPLLEHFVDAAVALVAPRVASLAGPSVIERYEQVRSPLDLGRVPARVRAGTRVSYVPAALMVCRVEALRSIDGFDPVMRIGEDVDLVWRLDEAGWRVRYEPAVTVHHRARSTWSASLRQRHSYGTSAAPLAEQHHGALAPVRVSSWSAASWLAIAAGWPIVGAVIAASTTALLVRKLRSVPDGTGVAVRLGGLGHIFAGRSLAAGLTRAWWPLTLLAAMSSRRGRRVAIVAFTIPAAIDWLGDRPRLDPIRYIAIRALDDTAYGTGLWQGCVRSRSVDALLPDLTSWPNAASRTATASASKSPAPGTSNQR